MSDADDTYRGMVADAVRERARATGYEPEVRRPLVIDGVIRPTKVEDLEAADLLHLRAIFSERLEAHLAGRGRAVERALVRDAESGEIVYRLYTWNHGAAYLFDAARVRLVAHATQHTVEVWSLSQRPLFYEMDLALRRGDHDLRQPLSFEHWNDDAWDEVLDAEPGTVASQPWLRDLLGLDD
jgi:hypothetical protein